MKVLFFGNNWTGWQVARWLAEQGDPVVGAVVHPPSKRSYADEILDALQLPGDCVFDGSTLGEPDVQNAIQELGCDIGVSVFFGYILKEPLLSLFPSGCVNLHPALLPFNRGAHPNVWSIIDGTPAGVTLHYVDSGIDTGDIIEQREVIIDPTDTGGTLYRRLELACVDLFAQAWPSVREATNGRVPQDAGAGTFHRASDLARLDEIVLDQEYTGREFINRLRARTFSGFPGCYFVSGARQISVQVELMNIDSAE